MELRIANFFCNFFLSLRETVLEKKIRTNQKKNVEHPHEPEEHGNALEERGCIAKNGQEEHPHELEDRGSTAKNGLEEHPHEVEEHPHELEERGCTAKNGLEEHPHELEERGDALEERGSTAKMGWRNITPFGVLKI